MWSAKRVGGKAARKGGGYRGAPHREVPTAARERKRWGWDSQRKYVRSKVVERDLDPWRLRVARRKCGNIEIFGTEFGLDFHKCLLGSEATRRKLIVVGSAGQLG